MNMDSLQDLYLEQLRDLYNAESQIEESLPEFIEGSRHSELRAAMERNVDAARRQRERLDQVFQRLEQDPGGEKCEAMEGLIREARELLERQAESNVHDAAMIASVQRMKHYLMAGYGTVRTYAQHLNLEEDIQALQESLDEEKNFDQELTQIAEQVINPEAAGESAK